LALIDSGKSKQHKGDFSMKNFFLAIFFGLMILTFQGCLTTLSLIGSVKFFL